MPAGLRHRFVLAKQTAVAGCRAYDKGIGLFLAIPQWFNTTFTGLNAA